MIQRAPNPLFAPERRPEAPADGCTRIAFATLWATGPDTRRDRVFRLAALRSKHGIWESFDVLCAPFADADGEATAEATQRMVREFGVHGADLRDAEPAAAHARAFADFLAGVPTVVLDPRELTDRLDALGVEAPTECVSLAQLADVLMPGRLASMGEALCAHLVPSSSRPVRAIGPRELRAAVCALVGEFLELPADVLALADHGYRRTLSRLRDVEPFAARALAFALSLAERPSAWTERADELFPLHPGLRDGLLAAAREAYPSVADAMGSVRPIWSVDRSGAAALPIEPTGAHDFPAEDERRVDEIFEHHLPKLFGGDSYREGQHQVAREVARSLAADELLLVHAPTGTGKTLAYLVPAILWAARHGVRVGVATFTRALQEQAMDREVPLALELVRRTEPGLTPAVALLKGRQNYVCWRALEAQAPVAGDDALRHLVWTRLVLFALLDADGDLDRLPRRSALPFDEAREVERELARIVGQVRARSGCCRTRVDRDTCGAEAARHRAERAHVVVTNHSLALARQGFFKYLVFDECEHLHDGAHAAYSHVLPFRSARELLAALHGGEGGGRRRPLERIRTAALRGTDARGCADECYDLVAATTDALTHVEHGVARFKAWREVARRERPDKDVHSLFREYAETDRAVELLDAHRLLATAWNQLVAALATLSEHLDDVPVRGKHRVRRSLDLLRADLEEFLSGIAAWIPRQDGEPAFRPETFYDVETDARRNDAMSARVLLPHEYLGRFFFPELRVAVCISATTWMGGSFEASAAYLGLQRAADPAPDEDREPSPYRAFLAPAPFDYGRVLVAVPRDAPTFRNADKEAYLAYTCRFVTTLAEKTRGRMLVLFTNAADCIACGRRMEGFFAERGIPLYYQRMEGAEKEELAERFRSHTDSVLLGLDTFWYGADFPGETLEYLVLVKLPYGVPDRYHHAQCAAIGPAAQRRLIYMPRALAKFRQGFGRLMRKETDKGCVFVLDGRVLDPRHRAFLKELPIESGFERGADGGTARLVRGDTERCIHEALAHMGMLADVRRHESDPVLEVDVEHDDDADADRVLEIHDDDVPY